MGARQLASPGSATGADGTLSTPTIRRLLQQNDYSLRVNAKDKEPRAQPPARNEQFEYIELQVARFRAAGQPMISADTKKKELIGDFKQAGRAWVQEPTQVNVHDLPTQAVGRAVPYGSQDVQRNRGAV